MNEHYLKKEIKQDMENRLLVIQNYIDKILVKYEENEKNNNDINIENNKLIELSRGINNMVLRN